MLFNWCYQVSLNMTPIELKRYGFYVCSQAENMLRSTISMMISSHVYSIGKRRIPVLWGGRRCILELKELKMSEENFQRMRVCPSSGSTHITQLIKTHLTIQLWTVSIQFGGKNSQYNKIEDLFFIFAPSLSLSLSPFSLSVSLSTLQARSIKSQ